MLLVFTLVIIVLKISGPLDLQSQELKGPLFLVSFKGSPDLLFVDVINKVGGGKTVIKENVFILVVNIIN